MNFPELLRRTPWFLFARSRLPGLLAALLVCAGSARAGYVSCPVAQEVGEFEAFAGDFLRWNAVNGNMPLLALEMTPGPEQGEMLLMLWWMWMLNPDRPFSSFSPNGGNSPSPPIAPIVGPIGLPPPPPPGGNGLSNSNGSGNGNGDGGGGSSSPLLSAPAPSALVLAGLGALGLPLLRRGADRIGRHRRGGPGRR